MIAVTQTLFRQSGELHHKAKLTNHEVELVRRMRDEGFSYTWIAQKFDTPKATIQFLCTFRRR